MRVLPRTLGFRIPYEVFFIYEDTIDICTCKSKLRKGGVMKIVDLTIPLGIATPPWPTYEPLQVKYFKRLAPNGANGQLVTHSNHVGTHLDGEIHFYTPGKDLSLIHI